MRITKYIHSCLLVEKGLDKILFDPGKFSFVEGLVKPAQFHDLSAIGLTHQHPDDVDDDSLKKILDNNPAAVVIANKEIKARLDRAAVMCKIFETGSCTINSFNLTALKAPHAPILDGAAIREFSRTLLPTHGIEFRWLSKPGDSIEV